jgi:hypothetical protein
MKRILTAIGLICFTSLQLVNGQFKGALGMKAGIYLSNQTYKFTPIDYTMETESILGPALAFFMEAFRGDHFSFQTDLAFACRGSSTTTQSVTVNHLDGDRLIIHEGDRTTSRFRYLSLSPMARFRTDLERITPYALGGIRLDMLLNYSTDSEYPLEEQNRLILGLNLGIGLELNLDRVKPFVEVQAQSDLRPVTGQDPLLVNNNSLMFTLGFRWIGTP